MPGRTASLLRVLAVAALLAGCRGAGATPGEDPPPRAPDTVEIGTALICDRTTCEERDATGRLVRSYPTPVTEPAGN